MNLMKYNVFDLACGRGGDNMKMYHSRIKNYVGIDVDYNGINSSNILQIIFTTSIF